jgi:methyltransferase (TIGR00027 family)
MSEIDVDTLLLSDVAMTGLLTAVCHTIESRSDKPILKDPAIEAIVDRLAPVLARSPNPFHRRLAAGRFSSDLVVHFALRARKYDGYCRDFVARHPGGCVVNLGCGLDTRFARIDDGRLHLYDLDLPEMIALKRALLPETERNHMVGMDVLDQRWMDRLADEQPGPFLFLAEGLFMYLPPGGVRDLVVALHTRFPGSELAFEAVNAKWLEPHLRWMISLKLQKQFGLGRGTDYQSGIRDGHEPETWSPGIRLIEEWGYLDEDEPKLGILRWLRNWTVMSRTQWTVRYALGTPPGPGETNQGASN